MNSRCYIKPKLQTDSSRILLPLRCYFYEVSRIFRCKHAYINNMQKYLEHIKTQGQNLKFVSNLTYF